MMLGSSESKDPQLISREVIFQVFQRTIPQHHGQTDGKTDKQMERRLAMAIPHSARHRVVEMHEFLNLNQF